MSYPHIWHHANQKAVGEKIASLENAEGLFCASICDGSAGLVFSSGMAAITTTLLTFLENGDHAVFSKGILSSMKSTLNLPRHLWRNVSICAKGIQKIQHPFYLHNGIEYRRLPKGYS